MKSNDWIRSLTFNGITDTTKGWANRLGVSVTTIQNRIHKHRLGKPYEYIFSEAGHGHHELYFTHDGVRLSISGWSRRLGLSRTGMKRRIDMFRTGKLSEERCFSNGELPQTRAILTYNGKKYTYEGLARVLDIDTKTLYNRFRLVRNGKMDESQLFVRGKIEADRRNYDPVKRLVLPDGTRTSFVEIAKTANCCPSVISRLYNEEGFTPDELVEWANNPNKRIRGVFWVDGKRTTSREIAKSLGIGKNRVCERINEGWDFHEAVRQQRISAKETQRRAVASVMRNRRIRELKKMGVII